MVSCLILFHSTITSLTKCKILRFIFHGDDYEINVIENNTVIIYLWNVKKIKIWQAAVHFESTNMFTGYGFGRTKENALNNANNILEKRSDLDKKKHFYNKQRGDTIKVRG